MKTLNAKTIVTVAVVIILFPLGYSVVSSVFSLGAQSSQEFLKKPEKKDVADFIPIKADFILEICDSDDSGALEKGEWALLRERGYVPGPYDRDNDGTITLDELIESSDPNECLLKTACQVDPRFHHWEVLKDVREEAMREGKRGGIAIDDCWRCHTSRRTFCNQCHNAVNLTLNCFRCHHDPDTVETGQ